LTSGDGDGDDHGDGDGDGDGDDGEGKELASGESLAVFRWDLGRRPARSRWPYSDRGRGGQ